MAAITFNSTIYQGASWSQDITCPGKDFTGFTGTCQMRKYASGDSTSVAAPVVSLVTPLSGIINLALTAAQTATIPVSSRVLTEGDAYVYDVLMTDGTDVDRAVQGTIIVYPAVTR